MIVNDIDQVSQTNLPDKLRNDRSYQHRLASAVPILLVEHMTSSQKLRLSLACVFVDGHSNVTAAYQSKAEF